jgi:hypothetical protein
MTGHHRNTDVEVVFNRQGNDLVLRVNKEPVQYSARCWSTPAHIFRQTS